MSGTELGRLMDEVTALPPVDVRFANVHDLVQRRRTRLRTAATSATVAAVVIAVGVPALVSLDQQAGSAGAQKAPAAVTPALTPVVGPASGPVIDPSWAHGSWNDVTWRMPSDLRSTEDTQRDRDVSSEKGPFGGAVQGPYLSTVPVGGACRNVSDGFSCEVTRIIARIPADAIVGEMSEAEQEGDPGFTAATPDSGTVSSPDATCTTWGGAASFTSSRNFGTAPFVHTVTVWACLGSGQVATAPAELKTLVASEIVTDAVTVDPSWRSVRSGDLSWRLPPDWSAADDPHNPRPDAVNLFGAYCGKSRAGNAAVSCPQPSDEHLAAGGAYAWISAVAAPSDPSSQGSVIQGNQPPPACRQVGGVSSSNLQRHLGPIDSGELITLTDCEAEIVSSELQDEEQLILDSIVDSRFPDPKQLCSTVPGQVSSAVLETVAGIRSLRWGTARPAATVFAAASPTDYAAWCWVRDDAAQRFDVWAAHAGDPAVNVVGVGRPTYYGTNPPPSVAPVSLFASTDVGRGPTPTPAASAALTPTVTPATALGVATGTTAKALCGSALGTYATAELTTVQDVRTATWGPPLVNGKGRLDTAFPGAGASQPAAWCWQRNGGDASVYAVHAGDAPVLAITIGGDYKAGQVPSGPPNVP